MHNDESSETVKQKLEPAQPVVWGARDIGAVINRTERQTHHLLTRKQIKSARKVGGRWSAGIPALKAEFGLN